jgi:hypothetical protein
MPDPPRRCKPARGVASEQRKRQLVPTETERT